MSLFQFDGVEIGSSLREMFELHNAFPIIVWKPVVEHDFGQERFLTENPTKLFRQGRFYRVPVMTGVTEYEFLYPAIGKIGFYFDFSSSVTTVHFRYLTERRTTKQFQ